MEMQITTHPSAESLTPEQLEAMRAAQAQEEKRQAEVQKLLQQRRLLKADLRLVETAILGIREQLSRAVARNQADRIIELRAELETKKAEHAELVAAIDAIDKNWADLVPGEQHGRFLRAAFSWPRP